MPLKFEKLEISDIILVKPERFEDDRGFFMETYKRSDFKKAGIKENFVQDNHSKSKKGVLRGLHYQNPPEGQGKLVRCIRGEIFDVAVDIRKASPYFGEWVGEELSEEDATMLYIPVGFAHGFLALTDKAEVIYKITEEYSPNHEAGIIWNDPDIDINWPETDNLIISKKDQNLPKLKDAENHFNYSPV